MNGTMRLSVVIDGQTGEATVAVNQVTAALDKLDNQAKQTGPKVGGCLRQIGAESGKAAKIAALQMQNMQFQLQDVVIGLTSGQSPFMVLMQQGSQMAQSFAAGTGPRAALASIGKSIGEFLTNPLNLAVAGFSLALAAGMKFFSSLTAAAPGLEDALERQEALVKAIRDRYTEAGRAAEQMGLTSRLEDLRQARDNQSTFQSDSDAQIARLPELLFGKIADPLLSEAERKAVRARAIGEDYGVFGDAVLTLITDIEQGKGNVLGFRDAVAAIASSAKDDAGVQSMAKLLQTLSKGAVDAAVQLEKSAAATRVLDGTATELDKKLLGLGSVMNEVSKASESLGRSIGSIPATIGGYGPRSPFAGAPAAFEGKSFLDLLGAAEGTDRGRGYNETLGYGKFTGGPADLITMTLNQVMDLQKRMLADPANTFNSSAVGRYQITRQTLQEFMPRLGLSGDTVFSPEVQDKIALAIANAAGRSVERLQGRWEGLKFVSPGTILGAFDGAGGERSGIAAEEQRLAVAKETKAVKEQEAEVAKLIAEAARRTAKEQAEYNNNALTMMREQVAFIDQFRGLTDGLVSGLAQAREAGGSWGEAFGSVLDGLKNKAISLLDSIVDKLLDTTLFGQQGSAGGGLLGGLLGSFFGGLGNPMQNAYGNAYSGPVTPFAKGGVEYWPRFFPMANGGVGQFAEAGPEAIMPLARGPSGHLGVRAQGAGAPVFNMSVVNGAGAEVSSSARPNGSGGLDIEMLIERKMDQHLGKAETVNALSQRLGTRPPVRQWG